MRLIDFFCTQRKSSRYRPSLIGRQKISAVAAQAKAMKP